ncbi:MAG: hypothetical protein P8R38_00035 [Planctomycetota bacterium]|nr:hypothetical protein [Planctomycetota bacterium]
MIKSWGGEVGSGPGSDWADIVVGNIMVSSIQQKSGYRRNMTVWPRLGLKANAEAVFVKSDLGMRHLSSCHKNCPPYAGKGNFWIQRRAESSFRGTPFLERSRLFNNTRQR